MSDVASHHLIYGHLRDFLTGESLVDTDDERYRQRLARLLVEERGFAKSEIEPRLIIETLFAGNFVSSKIDFVIRIAGKRLLLLRYGPGSLVTRERPALAAARVLDPTQVIPLAVVSNGEDAELLESRSGRVLGQGLKAIPDRATLTAQLPGLDFSPLAEKRREPELRILNAFDIEICCAGAPCALPGAKEG
ncbi:type I restriction enzyme HsdR N-terminal domain-containing protein [Desulfurivibrio sp. D14AmB]|uniref:type I restriction enzyme HsdR N-terminal domain-containing protein n=1 Tax=Desulfurivibrio sp. D14AmB TaxID=3374370 RepID=UPI00376EE74E